jgi:hypothetical protein
MLQQTPAARASLCFAEIAVAAAEVSVHDYATVNLNDRAPNEDSTCLILVIIVGTALIDVSPTAVLLGLAGRQPTISPASFLATTPSRRTPIAVTVDAVFVPVTMFPATVVIEMLVSVLVFVTLIPVICHQRRRAQA